MGLHTPASAKQFKTAEPAVLAWQGEREVSERTASILHFPQDRQIYGDGDAAGAYFKVVSGVVRTCKFLSDGRRQINAFYRAGDVFGLEWGLEHHLTAEAVSDCTVIPYRISHVDQMPSPQLFSSAMRNLSRAQEHSLMLGRRSAVEKLTVFLLEWAEQSASEHVISLAMTRQDIADYLGLTIETVSRTFSQLERDALIELPTTRQIHLKNLQALRDLVA